MSSESSRTLPACWRALVKSVVHRMEALSNSDEATAAATDALHQAVSSVRKVVVDVVSVLFVVWRTLFHGNQRRGSWSESDHSDLKVMTQWSDEHEPVLQPTANKPREDDFATPRDMSLSDFDDFTELSSEGSLSQIFRVKRKKSGEHVVLKTTMAAAPLAMAQFQREREIMHRLHGAEFIVKYHGHFTESCVSCLCLEYAAAGDLEDLRCGVGGIMKTHQAAFYVAEIALALKHMHSCAIVHRDLKPENVFITAAGHSRLGDFGLARPGVTSFTGEGSPDGRAQTMCGTPEFCAPEVLLNQPYGKAVDMYALGVVLYSLLLGRSPHSGLPDEVLRKATAERETGGPSFPDSVPVSARSLGQSLLRWDAHLRPTAESLQEAVLFTEDLMMDWDALLSHDLPPPIRVGTRVHR